IPALVELDPMLLVERARAGAVISQLGVPVQLVLQAARERPAGSLFLVSAAPSAAMTDPATAADLLAVTDVLVVNEHELADIAGDVGTEDAIVRVAEQVPVLIVTLGSVGALVVTGNERRQVPAFDVTAVDTTGAGDTFCGVLAARLAASRPADGGVPAIEAVAHACGAACAAAALAVGTAGAQDSVAAAGAVSELLAGSTTGR